MLVPLVPSFSVTSMSLLLLYLKYHKNETTGNDMQIMEQLLNKPFSFLIKSPA